DLDTGHGAAVAGAEVHGAAVHAHDLDTAALGEVDQLLKLARLPVEPVDVGDDDAANLAGADLVQHGAVLRPVPSGVGRGADVVVLELGDLPAPSLALGVLEAVGELVADSGAHHAVFRDAGVDRVRLGSPRVDRGVPGGCLTPLAHDPIVPAKRGF